MALHFLAERARERIRMVEVEESTSDQIESKDVSEANT